MKKIIFATFLALGTAGAALAATGLFAGFPIVGVPANTNCESYGNNNVCNQYTPAGPDTVAPTSTIAADTQLANGAMPQTIRIPAALTGASSIQASPLTGTTIDASGAAKLMLTPAGTIAALTVLMPTPTNGQQFAIYTTQTVTALTLTPSAGTTIPSTTTVTAAAPVKLIYNAGSKAWVAQ